MWDHKEGQWLSEIFWCLGQRRGNFVDHWRRGRCSGGGGAESYLPLLPPLKWQLLQLLLYQHDFRTTWFFCTWGRSSLHAGAAVWPVQIPKGCSWCPVCFLSPTDILLLQACASHGKAGEEGTFHSLHLPPTYTTRHGAGPAQLLITGLCRVAHAMEKTPWGK